MQQRINIEFIPSDNFILNDRGKWNFLAKKNIYTRKSVSLILCIVYIKYFLTLLCIIYMNNHFVCHYVMMMCLKKMKEKIYINIL